MLNEEEVLKDFEKDLLEALKIYESVKGKDFPKINTFIEKEVWNSLEKYTRMELTTKEKFFENLYKGTSLKEYEKQIKELWENVDHSDMTRAIKELEKIVIQKDFNDARLYGDKKLTLRSIKLENSWREYTLKDTDIYELTPARDFTAIEKRFVNRHIKLYKSIQNRYKNSNDIERDLTSFMKTYDKLDKTIPYYSHQTGQIIRYVDVSTYNSMLYNVNLTRSAWNRNIYDAKLLGNPLWYLPAHPFACDLCSAYQGRVYAEKRGYGYPLKDEAIRGGVGHPNCKHVWVSYWGEEQIQKEKYNSPEWSEKYSNKQKYQSLELEKSRLLADRRIYNNLGQQDLVDKTTSKIKTIRNKMKELEF